MTSAGAGTAVERDPLGALWSWLASWIGPDGGVLGPVVHRCDRKRLFSVHDTAWTQAAAVQGLLRLHRRSGRDEWLERALWLADAQCARLAPDGRFRRAGHEDDRFSALVHNALADCALLDAASVLQERGEAARRERYVAAAERNLRDYVVMRLYRPELSGFAMNPVDHYAGRDRFVLNMNAVAAEALVKLDRARGSDRHTPLVRGVGERIRAMQATDGRAAGGLPYSNLPHEGHVSLYTGLTLRGLPALVAATGEDYGDVARRALAFLRRMEDPATGLWHHRVLGNRLFRFPIFVAGAGMICDGILDAAEVAGTPGDPEELARRLLRFQDGSGAIRNFVGYDHPDNDRPRGSGGECWEDVLATPNWNAQAFQFLAGVLPPPDPAGPRRRWRRVERSPRFVHLDTPSISAVVGVRPAPRGVAALYVKRLRWGLVLPGPHLVYRTLRKALPQWAVARPARDRAVAPGKAARPAGTKRGFR